MKDSYAATSFTSIIARLSKCRGTFIHTRWRRPQRRRKLVPKVVERVLLVIDIQRTSRSRFPGFRLLTEQSFSQTLRERHSCGSCPATDPLDLFYAVFPSWRGKSFPITGILLDDIAKIENLPGRSRRFTGLLEQILAWEGSYLRLSLSPTFDAVCLFALAATAGPITPGVPGHQQATGV